MATHKRPTAVPDDDAGIPAERGELLYLIRMPDGHTHMLVVEGGSRTVVCPIVGCGQEYPEGYS